MSRATILIADDSSDIRTIMRYLLNDLGFAVVEAADRNEAVRLARQCQPVLILLDLCMPGIDGWEVATRLRADPALEEVPILARTAYNVSSAIRAALHAGCQQVVTKPFDLHDISPNRRAHVTARHARATLCMKKAMSFQHCNAV